MGKGSENISEISSKNVDCNNTSLENSEAIKTYYSWSEVKTHNKKDDCWIVLNNYVYNVTGFLKRHPGGSKVMSLYSGQDATEAFTAFHKDYIKVNKYRNLYLIGKIDPSSKIESNESSISTLSSSISASLDTNNNDDKIKQNKNDNLKIVNQLEIKKDFDELRQIADEMKLFEPSYTFFILNTFHIIFLYYLAYGIIWYNQGGLIPLLVALVLQVIAQAQAGWIQHDYGHSSCFIKSKSNKFIQIAIMGLIKGASADWWNYMHFRHHAKPNVIDKDPDVKLDPFFLVGKVLPLRIAEKLVKKNKKPLYPYTLQHLYFLFGAPFLLSLHFQIMTFRYAIQRKQYLDLFTMGIMYLVLFSVMAPYYGFFVPIIYFIVVRLLEMTWFTWVSQCNHIVMDVHDDVSTDSWLALQLKATCNITKSRFNDWFTGHLNFQIEHHLFPTMPRHNLYKIQPLVKSLCKKHNINYVVKPLGTAFLDILLSLKKSGEMWQEAYHELFEGN